MKKIDSFYINVDMGDLIYSLLFCKILGVENIYIDGGREDVKFNWKSALFLMPLIEHQDYIKNAQLYKQQKFDTDYGLHPNKTPVVVGTDLTAYHASKFDIPAEDPRLSQIWLDAPVIEHPSVSNKKILINRTSRYHGCEDFYKDFLKHVNPNDAIFAGLEEEHKAFCSTFNMDIDFIKTDNALDLATLINSIPTFVGNESLICSIAKGLGKNCFVEYGRGAANYIFNRQNVMYF